MAKILKVGDVGVRVRIYSIPFEPRPPRVDPVTMYMASFFD